MNDSDNIHKINQLVENKVDIYALFELRHNFTKQELSAHYKMKKAEFADHEEPLNIIELAYHVLKDEERLHIYNHYNNKRQHEELNENLNCLFQALIKPVKKLYHFIKNILIWLFNKFWLLVWIYFLVVITQSENLYHIYRGEFFAVLGQLKDLLSGGTGNDALGGAILILIVSFLIYLLSKLPFKRILIKN